MSENTLDEDRNLAPLASVRVKENPETIIGYLSLEPEHKCFVVDNIITWELNQVRLLFPSVLKEIVESNGLDKSRIAIKRMPLIINWIHMSSAT